MSDLELHWNRFRTVSLLVALSIFGCYPLMANTLTEIYAFPSSATPCSGVIQGANGNLYGTTPGAGQFKKGTVYQMTLDGTLVYSLSLDGTNGSAPFAGLIQTSQGNLYGTASGGGASKKGTVFRVTPSGALSLVASFNGQNGSAPMAPLLLMSNVFYGTTSEGGANGYGTIFSVSPSGVISNLFSFGGTNGANPRAGLVMVGGQLYGTTQFGGNNGFGTVFKLGQSNTLTTLVSFNGDNGEHPQGLMLARDGNLYGVTSGGGPNDYGLIFKMSTSGSLSTVAIFNANNGANPNAPLLQAASGNFYGTASLGGSSGQGVVFKFNSSGLTAQTSFDNKHGAYPQCALIQATDGNFYGVTGSGGSSGNGNLFQISGLSPNFTSGLKNLTNRVGTTAVFNVSALGSVPLGYQWLKNSNNLVDGDNIFGTATSTLTVSNVTMADAGVYTLLVTNSSGSASISARLVVKPTSRPSLVISTPKTALRTNDAVLFSGAATDNYPIVRVLWSVTNINNGVFTITDPSDATLSGTNAMNQSWTFTPTLLPGTNVVSVWCVDVQGNTSVQTRSVFSISQAQLALSTGGDGAGVLSGSASVLGDAIPADQALLNIGEGYSIQAKPAKNCFFANWTGTLGTLTNANITFVMQPGLTLQANFVTNRFPAVAGTYDGLFFDTNTMQAESSGMLRGVVVNSTGRFTGKLLLGGTTNAVSGAFDPFGTAHLTVKRAKGAVTLDLQMDWTAGTLTGTISGTNGAWTAPLLGYRTGNPLPASSRYNVLLPPTEQGWTNLTTGYGYATLVNKTGIVTMKGVLPDGTAFSETLPISAGSQFPVFASLYKGRGVLVGWLDFTSGAPAGTVSWAQADGTVSPMNITGSKWTVPTRGKSSLSDTNFSALIFGGGFTNAMRTVLALSTNNHLVASTDLQQSMLPLWTNAISGTIDPASGAAKFTLTVAPKKVVVATGVAVQLNGVSEIAAMFSQQTVPGFIVAGPLSLAQQPQQDTNTVVLPPLPGVPARQ